ncbi:MAG: hypothetical protein ACLFMZ_10660 [Spirochaetaceae bacterium]
MRNSASIFFGVGPEAAFEEDYEVLKTNFELMGLRNAWHRLYAGPLYRFDFLEYRSYEKDGAVAQYIPEQDNTMRTSGLGMVLLWDSRPSTGTEVDANSWWEESHYRHTPRYRGRGDSHTTK